MSVVRWLVLGIALFAVILPESRIAAGEGRRIALCVGVDIYAHNELTNLKFAAADATNVGEALKALGWEVTLLAETKESEQRIATGERIRAEWRELTRSLTRDDVALLYFSGQGSELASGGPVLIPADGNPEITGFNSEARFAHPETMISVEEIVSEAKDSGVGNVLILADACRDQPMTKASSPGRSPLEAPEGVAILLACERGGQSVENAALGHGCFTFTVLEALRGKAANSDGVVSWHRLVAHVADALPRVSLEPNTQHPTVISNLGKDVVLGRRTVK